MRVRPVQTLLEQLKGIFGRKPGIPLDKIPPTVGLNSTCSMALAGRKQRRLTPNGAVDGLRGDLQSRAWTLSAPGSSFGTSAGRCVRSLIHSAVRLALRLMREVVVRTMTAQERLRAIWNKYYSESHGIVFVVDSANEARFEEAKHTLREWSSRHLT